MLKNNGVEDFMLTENDLVVEDTQYKSQMSTVLMIDISHSMICMVRRHAMRWQSW
jgi:uncharacterized protein with von Willebrand factor type A (vWA) domain